MQYTSSENLYRGEIGAIGGVRFVMSTNAPKFTLSGDTMATSSGDIHGCIIVGQHAYGVTEITGSGQQQGYRMYIKPLGSAGADDPVDQKATVGWKMTMAARTLNKSAGVIVLYTAT